MVHSLQMKFLNKDAMTYKPSETDPLAASTSLRQMKTADDHEQEGPSVSAQRPSVTLT